MAAGIALVLGGLAVQALDSTYVCLNLSVAEQELSSPTPEGAQHMTDVLGRL